MIYFTSDTHFGHGNIIRYINRPFITVNEMDRTILHNFNKTVKEDDELYILGDFTMGGSFSKCQRYLDQINCKNVHLIRGNHDKKFLKNVHDEDNALFGAVDSKIIFSPFKTFQDYLELKYKDTKFVLSHYPFVSWNGSAIGSIQLHGHIHSSNRYNEINQWHRIRKFDVGVDANNFTPVSADYIIDFFNKSLEEIFN